MLVSASYKRKSGNPSPQPRDTHLFRGSFFLPLPISNLLVESPSLPLRISCGRSRAGTRMAEEDVEVPKIRVEVLSDFCLERGGIDGT